MQGNEHICTIAIHCDGLPGLEVYLQSYQAATSSGLASPTESVMTHERSADKAFKVVTMLEDHWPPRAHCLDTSEI